jgi:deferrochelatase/peroxidase EfeB
MATANEHQPSSQDTPEVKAASSGVSRRGMLSGALWAGVGGLAVGAAGGGAAGGAQAAAKR